MEMLHIETTLSCNKVLIYLMRLILSEFMELRSILDEIIGGKLCSANNQSLGQFTLCL